MTVFLKEQTDLHNTRHLSTPTSLEAASLPETLELVLTM